MQNIDYDMLDEMGLEALPESDKDELLALLLAELELPAGRTLSAQLTEEQLVALDVFIVDEDTEGAIRWLAETIPNYRETVEAILEELKAEILENIDAILSTVRKTE